MNRDEVEPSLAFIFPLLPHRGFLVQGDDIYELLSRDVMAISRVLRRDPLSLTRLVYFL